ncbi:MAG: DNA polymerase III subunit beta [Gammaproteobacteria bacterium]|nr:MAG: DNA polymerase III subunit beta [Gammaproteobacteria bacterium]
MKFTVKKDDLLPLLTRVNNIIEKKSTQKIRTHVLIRAANNEVELIGFDKEIKISGRTPAVIESSGETTVTSQKFHAIVSSIPNGEEALIELNDNSLDIVAGHSNFHLATIPAEDYPLPDSYVFEQSFSLPACDLVGLFNQVKFSMANNDVRHYLNGMLLHFTPSALFAVSTDGHRLSLAEIPNTFGIEEQKTIIPRKAVAEIIGWLSGEEENAQVNLSDTHLQVVFGRTELTTTVVNAEYPAYETVIPDLAEKLIVIPKEDLRKALQRAKILSSEYGVGVSLVFSPWKLDLSAKNIDNESVEDSLDINYDGEIIKTAFNINYLLEIISVVENENITLSLRDSQSSCLIFDAEKETARYVVMPMNI